MTIKTWSRLTKEWFDDLRLSLSEQLMLRLLMAGMTMEEVAVNLNTSLKSLYRSVLRFMSGWG
jgi:DNA-binding CsgD family transcriptional regulator